MTSPRCGCDRIALFLPRAGSIPRSSAGEIRRPSLETGASPDLPPDADSSSPPPVRRFPLTSVSCSPSTARRWSSSRTRRGSATRSSWRSTRPEPCRSSSTRPTARSSAPAVIAEYLFETRGARLGEATLMPATPERAGRDAPACRLVPRQDRRRGDRLSGQREGVQAARAGRAAVAARPTPPRSARRAPISAIICAISATWRRGGTVWPGAR